LIRSILLVILVSLVTAQELFHPEIPKLWDDTEMRSLELPLAGRVQVRHASAEYYYKIPVRPNLKTYPIYRPDKEPPGYFDWLNRQEPQPAYDPKGLKTLQDWIRAGETVFESAKEFSEINAKFTDVRNICRLTGKAFYRSTAM
jgi:hypothetical protein